MKIIFRLLLFLASFSWGQEFLLRLQLDHAHVEELYFACQEGCSLDYDKGSDIYCPPGGMGDSGLAWFVVTEPKLLPLYKDVRGCTFPQQWTIFAQPPKTGDLTFSWEEAKFPDGLTFELRQGEQVVDMRKIRQFKVSLKTELTLLVSRSPVSTEEQ